MSNAFGDELAPAQSANEFGDTAQAVATPASPEPLDPEKLFGGVDKWDPILGTEGMNQLNAGLAGVTDKVTAKKRAANLAFLSSSFGRPLEEVAATSDQYRSAWAKTVLKTDQPMDDGAFYDRVSGYLSQKREEASMRLGMAKNLFQTLRQLPESDTVPATSSTFSRAFDALIQENKTHPGYDPQNLDVYRQQMRQAWDGFQEKHTLLAEPINLVKDYMLAAQPSRPEDFTQMKAARDAAWQALRPLSDEDAQMVIDFAATDAKTAKKPETDAQGFLSKVGARASRGVDTFLKADIGAARELARRGVSMLMPDGQEAATLDRRDTKLQRWMDQRVTGEVDPLKGQGWIADSILGTAESAPKLAAFMAPAGIFAAALASKEELRGHYEDQGMSANQADLLSAAAAIPETALNFVQSKMIVGKVPGAQSLLRGSLASRVATLAVGETAVLTGVSELQQLAPTAVQSIAKRLDDTIPGVDFLSELKRVGKATPETMGSLLPFILIGTGSASFRDRAYGTEYLKNRQAMEALGIQSKYIEQVADSSSPEEAGAILQKAWKGRDPQTTPAQKEALVGMNLDSLQQREDMGQVLSQRYREVAAKYPEEFNSLPPDHLPAELQRADGSVVPVAFAGWSDGKDGGPPVESIAFPTEWGWSKGKPIEGEKLLTPVPSPEQWLQGVRDPDHVAIGPRSADTSSGTGKATPFEEQMLKDWQAQIAKVAKDKEGTLTVTDQSGPVGQAASPEGAAGVLLDRASEKREALSNGPTNLPGDKLPIIPQLPKTLLDLEARTDARLRELGLGGKLFAGLDPETNYLLTVKGALVIARGARDFAEFSAQMIRELGEKVRPHLQDLFKTSQDELNKHLELAAANGEESIAGPPDPNADTEERTVTGRMSRGEGIARGVAPEIRAALDGIEYPVRHMTDVQETAAREIAHSGEAAAFSRFMDSTNDIKPDVRVAMGKQLAEKFAEQGNWPAWHDTIMRAAELGTAGGQGINMFKIYGDAFTTPEAAGQLLAQEVNRKKTRIRKTERTQEVASVLKEEAQKDAEALDPLQKLHKELDSLTTLLNEGTLDQIAERVGPKAKKPVAPEFQRIQDLITATKKTLRGELKNKLAQLNLRPLLEKIDRANELINHGTPEEIRAYFEKTTAPKVNEDVQALRDIIKDADQQLRDRIKAAPEDKEKASLQKLRDRMEHLTRLVNEGTLDEIATNLIKPKAIPPSEARSSLEKMISDAQGLLRRELSNKLDPDKVKEGQLKAKIEELTAIHNRGDVVEMSDAIHGDQSNKRQEPARLVDLRAMLAEVRKAMKGDLSTKLDLHEVKLRDLSARIEENVRLLNEGTTEEISAHIKANEPPLQPADIVELKKVLRDSRKALEAAAKEPTDFEARVKARLKEMDIQAPKDIQRLYKRSLELFQEGKLTEKGLEEVLLEKHALPDIGGEHSKRLSDFAATIASTPKDSAARRDATIDLFDYVHSLVSPSTKVDVGFALFYAHILSGYPTHVRNTLSNVTALAEFGIDALFSHPKNWADKWDGILSGGRAGLASGIAEARQLTRTGKMSPLKEGDPKFGMTSILEQTKFTGLARPYNLSKYVGRLLRASDVFFATTAYEVKARQVAWEMARAQGGKDLPALAEKVDSVLNQSPQQIADHQAQAVAEYQMLHPALKVGQTEAQWVDSRTRELRLLDRDEKLVQRSSDLASRLTFNYKSEGFVGFFANSLIAGFTALRKAGDSAESPLLKFMTLAPRVEIPFIQIPANLFARAWEFGSGVSIVKALYGKELIYDGPGAAHFEAMSEDVRNMMLKRGIVGLASLATLAVAGYPTTGKDEENRLWRIHGRGTGDPDKNKALWGPKYRQYSIQFNLGGQSIFLPYKFLPIGPALAMVGAIHDGARYKQFDSKDGTYRLASAMKAIPQAMLSQSFMVQLNDSLDALMGTSRASEDSTRRAIARFTAGSATSVAIPLAGFWSSIDRDFDPKQRDTSTVKASLMAQVIGLRHLNRPAIDILGDDMTNRPADWFYTATDRGTPEAKVYATFARLNLDPGDGSGYKQRLGDQFYDFFKARQGFIKARLLDNNGAVLDRMNSEGEEHAKMMLSAVDQAATQMALRAIDYHPPRPVHKP